MDESDGRNRDHLLGHGRRGGWRGSATALGYGIHTQGNSVVEIRRNVGEAVDCYFEGGTPRPKLIRLHFVRDEVLAG